LVEDYYLLHKHIAYPVTEGEKIVGLITLRRVKEVPRVNGSRDGGGDDAPPGEFFSVRDRGYGYSSKNDQKR
jgi:hypothetical protein